MNVNLPVSEKVEMIFYGLRHKGSGEVLGVVAESNAGQDYCVDTAHRLFAGVNDTWLVQSPEHAEWVRHNSTPWYNASYDTPQHEFDAHQLEVVEVVVTVRARPVRINIPTFDDLVQEKLLPQPNIYEEHLRPKGKHGYEYYKLIQWLQRRDMKRENQKKRAMRR